jgi:hypothetical protein
MPMPATIDNNLVFIPSINPQNFTHWILHGKPKILEFFFPECPIISVKKGKFPEAVIGFEKIFFDKGSQFALKFHHGMSDCIRHKLNQPYIAMGLRVV